MGQFATQWPKATLEKEKKMRKYHFKMWGWDWKCWHCNKRSDYVILAKRHFLQAHKTKLRERSP